MKIRETVGCYLCKIKDECSDFLRIKEDLPLTTEMCQVKGFEKFVSKQDFSFNNLWSIIFEHI